MANFIRISLLGLLLICSLFFRAMANHSGPQFSENRGQWEGDFKYKTAIPGGFLFVEDGALTYLLYEEKTMRYFHAPDGNFETGPFQFHAYRMRFLGASPSQHQGEKAYPHYENYYLGNDPDQWQSRVPVYERLRQSELYPGVDLLLYNKMGSLKYDLRLAPNADPGEIIMEYEGADALEIIKGELHIHNAVNTVVEKAPFAYQLIEGKLIEIECRFALQGQQVGFELGEYDPMHELIIDPELSFASYSGSTANNFGFTATDDEDGLLYAGSIVYDAGYPTTIGAYDLNFNVEQANFIDVALSKFSEGGAELEFSTYLGGSGQEMPHSIIVNSLNELIVFGNTGSSNFPTTNDAFNTSFNGGPAFSFIDVSFGAMQHENGCDLYLSRFSADGSELIASTFIGGSGNDGLNIGEGLNFNYGDVFRGEVIADEDDKIFVASVSGSADFPIPANAAQASYGGGESDAVVFKMSSDLSNLEWASYWGGINDDSAYSVQIDSNGNVFVAGGTKSSDLNSLENSPDPNFNGFVDGFLLRISPDGSELQGQNFIGTVNYEQCYFVQLDTQDDVFIIGQTKGFMEVSDGKYFNEDGKQFIRKYSNDLSTELWTTVFGAGNPDVDISPCAFLVSDCDNIYVSGWGGQTNNGHSAFIDNSSTLGLPITSDAFQATTDGSDFYLMVLSPEAEDLVYATFFGGDLSNEHVDGGTSKFDKNGSVYQAVCAGCGGNDDFPITPGVWSEENNSSCNLGVFKFDLAKITAEIDLNGPDVICEGEPMNFENLSDGGENFIWFFGDGENSDQNSPTHTYEEPGIYEVMLLVTDDNDCVQPDSAFVEIEVLAGVNPEVLDYDDICDGDSLLLTGVGSENAYWSAADGLEVLNNLEAIVVPTIGEQQFYFVDENECGSDSVEVEIEFFDLEFNISDDQSICIGESVELSAEGGGTYSWTPTIGLSDPTSPNPTSSPEETTVYTIEIESPEGCEYADTVLVEVINNSPGGDIYEPVRICLGDVAQLEAEDGSSWNWSPAEFLNDPALQNPRANVSENTLFTVEITNICGFGESQVWVEISQPEAAAGEDQEICIGESVELWATGGLSYNWSPSFGLENSNTASPTASPPIDTEYEVYVSDEVGCIDTATVNIVVHPLPEVYAGEDLELIWYEPASLNGSAEGQFFWDPRDMVECFDCASTLAYPEESQWFYLESFNEFGCRNVDSVFVELLGPLFVPNAFTPNFDGENDVFLPISMGLDDYQLQIYDRWGEMLFETTKIEQGWPGTYKNQRCPPGVYVWHIRYNDPIKGDTVLLGHVTLVR